MHRDLTTGMTISSSACWRRLALIILELQPALRGRPHTAHHAHITPTGPEEGDCMLRDEIVTRPPGDLSPTLHVSQARPRSASTPHTLRSLYEGAAEARWRSSKTMQTRIRFRSSSDIPMECVTLLGQCVGPPDNIRGYVELGGRSLLPSWGRFFVISPITRCKIGF